MPKSGVLWLVEAAVVGLGLLSRKYCFLVAGAVKVQNRWGEYQSEKLKFLDSPKDTIQVCRTRIASWQKTGLSGIGTTERKLQLDQYTSRSKPPLMTLCLIAKFVKNPTEIGMRTNVTLPCWKILDGELYWLQLHRKGRPWTKKTTLLNAYIGCEGCGLAWTHLDNLMPLGLTRLLKAHAHGLRVGYILFEACPT